MADTICWACGRNGNDCSWMDDYTPVEGWTAEKYSYYSGECSGDSYVVSKCPNFKYNGICKRCVHYDNGKFLEGCRTKKIHYLECPNSHNKFITHREEN